MKGRLTTKMHAVMLAALLAAAVGILQVTYFSPEADAKETSLNAAWLAYWDAGAGARDLAKLERRLQTVVYFGAYFDADDRLFVPQELSEAKDTIEKKSRAAHYLSFVNDRLQADGSVVLKDVQVLQRVLADETAREEHAQAMVRLALADGYDGIELDYERVWKDKQSGPLFLRFLEQLQTQASQHQLKLRVVLEPGAPLGTAAFTPGPEYVVMFYNLYGLHSGPGPKADKAFIEKIARQMQALPGEKTAAFATGGCLWSDNGEKRFVTEREAKALAKAQDAKTKRDPSSQCVVFSYQDKGSAYTVWYADATTLNYWIATAKGAGISRVSLWRLGGNADIGKVK